MAGEVVVEVVTSGGEDIRWMARVVGEVVVVVVVVLVKGVVEGGGVD